MTSAGGVGAAAEGVPAVVSSRFEVAEGHTLVGYKTSGSYRGYEALRAVLDMAPDAVTAHVKDATLLGRGGAGFPAGVKWGFCPPGVWPRYLVVNGDESEPGTFKDRLLMERDPHQLIEGCLIAAYAIGAAQVFLYVRGEMPHAQERIAAALNEAYEANLVGQNILGTDFSVDIVLHWGAGAYIVGEETALIESLEGNRGMPRLKPPFFPAAKGVYLQPTIVNNVETLSNLPWLFNHGVEAYRSVGTEASPGTRLIALSGHVNRPGVYEVPQGTTTFRELFEAEHYGAGIRDGNELKMFIPGGASAPWFFPEQVDLPLEGRVVGGEGSMLGSGAIVVMDDTTDAVRACLRVVRFFARESCGKCTPCREGTTWEEKILQRILDGHGRPSDIDLLLDVADNISPGPYPVAADPANGLDAVPFPPRQTTICPLGPSSVAPITSAIRRFRHEFESKITRRDSIPVAVEPVLVGAGTAPASRRGVFDDPGGAGSRADRGPGAGDQDGDDLLSGPGAQVDDGDVGPDDLLPGSGSTRGTFDSDAAPTGGGGSTVLSLKGDADVAGDDLVDAPVDEAVDTAAPDDQLLGSGSARGAFDSDAPPTGGGAARVLSLKGDVPADDAPDPGTGDAGGDGAATVEEPAPEEPAPSEPRPRLRGSFDLEGEAPVVRRRRRTEPDPGAGPAGSPATAEPEPDPEPAATPADEAPMPTRKRGTFDV